MRRYAFFTISCRPRKKSRLLTGSANEKEKTRASTGRSVLLSALFKTKGSIIGDSPSLNEVKLKSWQKKGYKIRPELAFYTHPHSPHLTHPTPLQNPHFQNPLQTSSSKCYVKLSVLDSVAFSNKLHVLHRISLHYAYPKPALSRQRRVRHITQLRSQSR